MQRQRVLISVSAFACGVHVAVVVVVSTAVAVIVNISILSQHKFVYHIVYYIVCTAPGLQRVQKSGNQINMRMQIMANGGGQGRYGKRATERGVSSGCAAHKLQIILQFCSHSESQEPARPR